MHHTDKDKPRLYIDRVFTITGSGTVVTGTLVDGTFNQDQKITIYPQNLSSRIRGIESYKQKVNKGLPGSRVALNLMGIKKDEIQRGDIVFSESQQLHSSVYLNGRINLPDTNPYHLKDKAKTVVHLGTRIVPATVRLIRNKILHPGESGYAQLQLKEPVNCRIGDRFILRRPSPAITIGGGTVLDPLAEKLRAKNEACLAGWLEQREKLEPGPVILSELEKRHYVTQDELIETLPWEKKQIKNSIAELKDRGLSMAGQWIMATAYIETVRKLLQDLLAEHHKNKPLGSGMTQAEMFTQTGIPKEILDYIITSLARDKLVRLDGNYVSLSTHTPSATTDQETLIQEILELFAERKEFPPTRKELSQLKPGCESLLAYMCRQQMLVDVGDDILLEFNHYQQVKEQIIDLIAKNGSISIQTARKLFGFTRKFILPIFNKLDHEGITMLVNNERVFSRAYKSKLAT
jgi:selenocysteine-specific elongation factor